MGGARQEIEGDRQRVRSLRVTDEATILGQERTVERSANVATEGPVACCRCFLAEHPRRGGQERRGTSEIGGRDQIRRGFFADGKPIAPVVAVAIDPQSVGVDARR